ncbi:MAG: TetR-like C-terminal domain-containing protein [Microthrixaceae bacterium]
MALAYRSYAEEHQGRYEATPARRARTRPSAEAAEALLSTVFAVLAGYGLTGDDAMHATRAVHSGLHGFVSLEAAGAFGMPQSVDAPFELLVSALDGALTGWPTTQGAANGSASVAGAAGRAQCTRRHRPMSSNENRLSGVRLMILILRVTMEGGIVAALAYWGAHTLPARPEPASPQRSPRRCSGSGSGVRSTFGGPVGTRSLSGWPRSRSSHSGAASVYATGQHSLGVAARFSLDRLPRPGLRDRSHPARARVTAT